MYSAEKAILDLKICREIVSLKGLGYQKHVAYWMTLSFSYTVTWINYKVSYKDTYKKRAPPPE